jgi:hypothetical protein
MVIEPAALTLAMVSLACAKAVPANKVATAKVTNCFFIEGKTRSKSIYWTHNVALLRHGTTLEINSD